MIMTNNPDLDVNTAVLLDTIFDGAFANQLAQFEAYNKHLYRPHTYLHKWWARRCGSTFRLILKHLVPHAAQRDYYQPGGLAGHIILDPMMGGGTTLHEAIRLGANVIGADIDPIPILQARATLSHVPLADLEAAFAQFLAALTADLSPFYQTTCPHCQMAVPMRYLLYGLRRYCPCGESLFVDSLILRHQPDGSVIRICPQHHHIYHDEALVAASSVPHPRPIRERTQSHCADCGLAYQEPLTDPYYQRYVPLAIMGKCPEHRIFFTTVGAPERQAMAQAEAQRAQLGFTAEAFLVRPGPKSDSLVDRAVTTYLDLFSSRQLLFLHQAIQALAAYPTLVRLNLALLVSTSLEFNSMLCGYKGAPVRRAGAIRHTFTYHAYSFPYTAVENNPLYKDRSSGSLRTLFRSRVVRGRRWAKRPIERRIHNGRAEKVAIDGERDAGQEVVTFADLKTGQQRFMLQQGSSVSLALPDHQVDYIVTDPPYFDSVQYSDLAAFFRVWLRQLLPGEIRWHYGLEEAAVKQQSNGNGTGQYRQVLSGIFRECARVLKPNGRFIFTFHHWKPKGWMDLTMALKQAHFQLVNRYVVHAENPVSVHIANQKVLLHDVILVLAPAQTAVTPSWTLPSLIRKGESDAFCEDCGTVVGYCLNSDLSQAAIEAIWQRLLT